MSVDSVQIGPIRFTVQFVDNLKSEDGRPLDGWIRYGKSTISIDSKCGPQYARAVLWHEIVHGILDNAGLEQPSESVITAIGYGIIDVLDRNPELAAFTLAGTAITNGGKGKK